MKTAFLTSARFCAWSRRLARLQKSVAALFFRLPYCCWLFARVDQREGLKESPESVPVEAQNLGGRAQALPTLEQDLRVPTQILGSPVAVYMVCQSSMEEMTVMLSTESF